MKRIVAFTGAGISKSSGIPTFEEMGDLRTKLSRGYFNNNPQEFYNVLLKMKEMIDKAEPNPAHLALAKYNIPIITMNIDGLHKKAGSSNVLEVHGNLEYVYCKKCGTKYPYDIINKSLNCGDCDSLLQPNVVLYGDMIPNYHNGLVTIGESDHLLVIGTSFYTSTAGDYVNRARRAGIKVTIINEDSETEIPKLLCEVFKD